MIEYAVLFVIIIGAFLIMRNYIQRGVFGMWGQSGQSFGFGRQYDSQKTIECSFDEQSNHGMIIIVLSLNATDAPWGPACEG